MSEATAVLVDLVVALGLVVILPLGLSLLGPRAVPGAGTPWWPAAGAVAAAGAWLPRGPLAQAATLPFVVGSAVLLVAAVRVAAASPTAHRPPEVRLAVGVALVMPGVGAAAMLADRGGWGLLGFSGTYLTLTVPHMLYAGFAAVLVAGLTVTIGGGRTAGTVGRTAGGRPAGSTPARLGAVGVPLGTGLVLVGYFLGDAVELAGALVLTAALWCTARAVLGIHVRPGARALLVTGSLTVGASMLLAVWWAAGELTGAPHPSIGQMAATHGIANSLGFALCTLLGLRAAVAARTAPAAGPTGPVTPAPQDADRSGHRPSRTPGRRPA